MGKRELRNLLAVGMLISGMLGAELLGQPQPETLGAINYLDTRSDSLTPLERQSAKVTLGFNRLMFGVGGASAEIKGEKSPIRIELGRKPEFIVQLATGVDPNKFALYKFQRSGAKRKLRFASAGAPESAIPCDMTKFGDASYKITPAQELATGEYGFSPRDSNEVFAFGVDPPEPASKSRKH